MGRSPIDVLMIIRINVLPPYCYDDDESEHDREDYESFFRPRHVDCLSAVSAYIDAWLSFKEKPSDEVVFQFLLEKRRRFIETIPFAYDELVSENNDYEAFVEHMKGIYQKEANVGILIKALREYEAALIAFYENKVGFVSDPEKNSGSDSVI